MLKSAASAKRLFVGNALIYLLLIRNNQEGVLPLQVSIKIVRSDAKMFNLKKSTALHIKCFSNPNSSAVMKGVRRFLLTPKQKFTTIIVLQD